MKEKKKEICKTAFFCPCDTDRQKKMASCLEEEQEQIDLVERLGQLNLRDTKEEAKIKEERKRGE